MPSNTSSKDLIKTGSIGVKGERSAAAGKKKKPPDTSTAATRGRSRGVGRGAGRGGGQVGAAGRGRGVAGEGGQNTSSSKVVGVGNKQPGVTLAERRAQSQASGRVDRQPAGATAAEPPKKKAKSVTKDQKAGPAATSQSTRNIRSTPAKPPPPALSTTRTLNTSAGGVARDRGSSRGRGKMRGSRGRGVLRRTESKFEQLEDEMDEEFQSLDLNTQEKIREESKMLLEWALNGRSDDMHMARDILFK